MFYCVRVYFEDTQSKFVCNDLEIALNCVHTYLSTEGVTDVSIEPLQLVPYIADNK